MKHIAMVALMLNLGAAGVFAQQRTVKMTFSGTAQATTFNLQPGTITDEVNLAGNGTLGSFTYRELHADLTTPAPSSTCSGPAKFYFPTVVGAAVFRFQEGSLLMVKLTQGAICVDLSAGVGHLTVTYQVTGGTGRFKSASGSLTLTAMLTPLVFDASGAAVLLPMTGEFQGTVSGASIWDEWHDERQ